MEISRDLEMAIANDLASIKSVDVNYINGKTISGFVQSARLDPLNITICEHVVARGTNLHHYLDFDTAISITIIYRNGKTLIFE